LVASQYLHRLTIAFLCLLIFAVSIDAQNSNDAIPIRVGETAAGEINGQADVYRFEATAGDVRIVDVMSEDFRPVVDIRGPGGETIVSHMDGETLASAAFVAPEDGTYTFFAGGFNNRGEGAYTVRLRAASAIEFGQTITDTLDNGANAYDIVPEADGLAIITLEPIDDDLELEMRVLGEANRELASASLLSMRPERLAVPLTAGQTVALVVDFWFVSDRLDGRYALSIDIIEPQPLLIDIPYTVEVVDFAVQYLTFDAVAGETIHVTADSGYRPGTEGVDTQLELIAPDGTRVARDSSNGPYVNPAITRVTLPQDGRYHLILAPEGDRTGSGSVEVLVESTDRLSLSTGQVALTLGERFDEEILQFEAEPNVHYRLRITPEARTVEIDIEIDAETFDPIRINADNASRIVFDFTVPDTAQRELATIHLRQFAPNEPVIYNVGLETVE
jgi:hypothetical protein